MTQKYQNKRLIGLTGPSGAGKDAIGTYLVMSKLFHRMAFADPVKKTMAAFFGVSLQDFHSVELKNKVCPVWGLSRRAMLHRGSDALKGEFGADHFTRRLVNDYLHIADREDVVVTDVRTDDEARAMRELGGKIVLVLRPGAGLTGADALHHLEQGVSASLISAVVVNDGSLQDLYDRVFNLLGSLYDE